MSSPTIIEIPWTNILKKVSLNQQTITLIDDLFVKNNNSNSKVVANIAMKKEFVKNQPFVFNGKYYYGIRKGMCENIESYFNRDTMSVLNLLLLFQNILNDITLFKSLFEKQIMAGFGKMYEIAALNYNTFLKNKNKYNQQSDKNLISLFIENDIHYLRYKVPYLNKFPVIRRFNASSNILSVELEKTFLLRSKNPDKYPNKKISFTTIFKLFLDKNNEWQLLDDKIYKWKIYIKQDTYEVFGRKMHRHYFAKDDLFSYHYTSFSNQVYDANNENVANRSIYMRGFIPNAASSEANIPNIQYVPLDKMRINTWKHLINEYSGLVGRGVNLFLNNQFYTQMPAVFNFTESSRSNNSLLHIPTIHKRGRQNTNVENMNRMVQFVYYLVTLSLSLSNFIRMLYSNIFDRKFIANPENNNMCYNNIIHYKNNAYFEIFNFYPMTEDNEEGEITIHSYCFSRFRIYFDTKRNYKTNYMSLDVFIYPVRGGNKENILKKIQSKHENISQFHLNNYDNVNNTIKTKLTNRFQETILPALIRENPQQEQQIQKSLADILSFVDIINYIDFYLSLNNLIKEYSAQIGEVSVEQWKNIYTTVIGEHTTELDKVSLQFEKLYYDIIDCMYQVL